MAGAGDAGMGSRDAAVERRIWAAGVREGWLRRGYAPLRDGNPAESGKDSLSSYQNSPERGKDYPFSDEDSTMSPCHAPVNGENATARDGNSSPRGKDARLRGEDSPLRSLFYSS